MRKKNGEDNRKGESRIYEGRKCSRNVEDWECSRYFWKKNEKEGKNKREDWRKNKENFEEKRSRSNDRGGKYVNGNEKNKKEGLKKDKKKI